MPLQLRPLARAVALSGCRVTLARSDFGYALKRFKRLCLKRGAAPEYHETKGQRERRKEKAAARRERIRKLRDP